MAFATANVRTVERGPLRETFGTWSGAVGDANGSVVVWGGLVLLASFTTQDSNTSPSTRVTPTSVSLSGDQSTITVYNHETVTSGVFYIVSSSG